MLASARLVVVGCLALASELACAAIAWRGWDAAAFEAARSADRPILVNVGHEGCSACRAMAAGAFSDPRVIALVNQAFVAIQVDSEMQPDIGERYSDWAWPATAFLKPDGTQVFAIRGSRRPDDFLALLEQVVERHRAGELATDALAPYGTPSAMVDGPLAAIRDQVRRQLDRGYDDARGGWGEVKVFESSAAVEELFARAYLHGDERAGARALQTAGGLLAQLDPVWGGMFYASLSRWDEVIHELRLESQAAALVVFADALEVSGEARYAEGLADVRRSLATWMTAPDGTFYANLKDIGPALPAGMDADDYYALDDAGRRRVGLPAIDRAIYTDVNARVILGLTRAFEATGDRAYLEAALAAARALAGTRQTDAGWLRQFDATDTLEADRRVHVVTATGLPYLRTQAWFGLAALALYQATADEMWKACAERVANGLAKTLADPGQGGFYAAPPSALDAIVGRRKPLEDNALAARLVVWLGVLNQDPELIAAGERTVRAVALASIVRREGRVTGNLALTLELLIEGYVELSVVGDGPASETLLAAGRRHYEPRGVLHREAPGRYPARDRAAMYICNADQCTVPITEAEDVPRYARGFRPVALRGTAGVRSSMRARGNRCENGICASCSATRHAPCPAVIVEALADHARLE
jgi:uncharacterized protein YyaL (SSP411 family)